MPFLFVGILITVVVFLYNRQTGIIKVSTLSGARPSAQPPDDAPAGPTDFSQVIGAVRDIAREAGAAKGGRDAGQGRAFILALARAGREKEAVQFYRRMYGTDQEAALRAVREMTLGR